MNQPNPNYDVENKGVESRVSERDDRLFNRPYDRLDAEEVARKATEATQSGDKEPGFNSKAKE